jgi:hypothetical protein
VPDSNQPLPPTPDAAQYRIMRRSSLYNILGPQGRLFERFKSAAVVGPRWEELTHTPWPYPSSAYEAGMRLWELGLIGRDQVGQREMALESEQDDAAADQPFDLHLLSLALLLRGLPAPRIDLEAHNQLIAALRRNPSLLFDAATQQALHHEIEYHRPGARWAAYLLRLAARHERREARAPRPAAKLTGHTIMARHVAWQEQQARLAQARQKQTRQEQTNPKPAAKA